MAGRVFRTNHVLGLFISALVVSMQNGSAYEFMVGGSKGWTAPTDTDASSYNQWAESQRFQIGDSLSFVYADKDSVLHVTYDDYKNCNTDKPIEKFSGGHTQYKFVQPGPHYFISGIKENCLKNEKLVVVVMADRSNRSSSSPPPPPSTPSPAPGGEESLAPPPGSVEMNPAPAPTADQTPPPPRNGAGSVVMSFICSVGAFVGSSLFLVF